MTEISRVAVRQFYDTSSNSFKTERQVFIATNAQMDMAYSTSLSMPIHNEYLLYRVEDVSNALFEG